MTNNYAILVQLLILKSDHLTDLIQSFKLIITVLLSVLLASTARAQPVRLADPRPKFFELNFQSLPAIRSLPSNSDYPVEYYDDNRLIETQLSFPVWLGDNLKVFSQIKYKNEVLNLGGLDDDNQQSIYFKNAGISLLAKWQLNEKDAFITHFSTSLKSDRFGLSYFSEYFDISNSYALERKINNDYSFGIGFIWSNSWGRVRYSPIFIYTRRLPGNYLLDLKLPKSARVYKLFTDGFYLYTEIEGNAAAYNIHKSIFQRTNLEYRRASIDLKIGMEKEIHDFLWCSFEAGYGMPFRSFLIKSGDRSRERLHNFNTLPNPFVKFSVFAVPPKSLFNKIK